MSYFKTYRNRIYINIKYIMYNLLIIKLYTYKYINNKKIYKYDLNTNNQININNKWNTAL